MKEDLVEKLVDVILAGMMTDVPDFRATARACLSAIEADGKVILPRDGLSMLLEVHTDTTQPELAIRVGARPERWHSQEAYIAGWESLRTALASPKQV